MTDRLWYFDDVNLYDVMCPHKIREFGVDENHFRTYEKGETIYFTDDSANTMYLIASGKVRILNYSEEGDEVVKAILGRGEMFGELALLGEDKRSEIAESMENGTTVCPVKIDDVQELMRKNRDFSFKIYKWIGFRIRKMERRIDNLVFKDVRSRLMDFIRELAVEKGEKKGDTVVIEHFYTHKNIANLIGTSRQTVTTTLNELRDEGLIDFDRKAITIKSLEAF
ncbi:MAG: Crp/Fnr family transcriptional regulator [Owenweeksia sp.]